MIKKLKRRFIMLAMASLIVLLSVIVAGMNILNYNSVVSNADDTLEMLSNNRGRLPLLFDDDYDEYYDGYYEDMGDIFESMMPRYEDEYEEDDDSDSDTADEPQAPYYKEDRGGRAPSWMTRDEAEETRYFTVLEDSSGNAVVINTDRIYAVDSTDAAVYAEKALASGKEKGFVGDLRYSVSDSTSGSMITFLDCGRTLGSFRAFLRASILMSLIGLIAVFFVILYFAGRIVRPVAESYEKQKRFITDAGHEIKTPLAIIKANIDLMDMELDNKRINKGELRENLGDINDQVDRLTGLTNDLVYLSRMEEADNSLVMTDVPLSDIVSETVSSFESLAWESGKAIAGDISEDVTVKGSTKELEKLLSILLENAIKYSIPPRVIDCGEDEDGMPVPPEIKVVLRREGKNAVLEVSNETENELTNEQLSHVFERFYRMDSSRNSQTGGHGIGLSMANAIVNAHGGHISAHTKNGHDFIVTATFPLQ